MKSEEEHYVSTGIQLQSSYASPEKIGTPSETSQSSSSQTPIGPPISVSLVNQSACDYPVLQGLTRIKSDDPAEIHIQEGLLPFDKMCRQKDRRATDYCESHVQVKSEKGHSDECNSNSGEIRKSNPPQSTDGKLSTPDSVDPVRPEGPSPFYRLRYSAIPSPRRLNDNSIEAHFSDEIRGLQDPPPV
ncbi:hypothetical protein LSAT2_003014 [Lamellibrachia satsuma]|nr:hypothetical protein LSAT2_003014 [Lamellibrachia satsuma]